MKPLLGLLLTAATLSASPQAVVFDFGGVLTGEPNREAVVHFLCESLQLSESEFEKANLEKRQAVKEGQTDEEFWIGFAKRLGVTLESRWPSDFRSAMIEAIGINSSMFAMVAELKGKNVPVALLSNIDERLAKIIRGFGFYEPFDPCLLSYELGVEKPDRGAYEILLEKLRCPPLISSSSMTWPKILKQQKRWAWTPSFLNLRSRSEKRFRQEAFSISCLLPTNLFHALLSFSNLHLKQPT